MQLKDNDVLQKTFFFII